MNQPVECTVAVAIESYAHAPRTLTVLEVVMQVLSVFPDQDHATLAARVRKSRQKPAVASADVPPSLTSNN